MIRHVTIISNNNDFHEYVFDKICAMERKDLKDILSPLIEEVCKCQVSYVKNAKIERNEEENGFLALCVKVRTNDVTEPLKVHNEMILFIDINLSDEEKLDDSPIALSKKMNNKELSSILYPIFANDASVDLNKGNQSIKTQWNSLLQTTEDTYNLIKHIEFHEDVEPLRKLILNYYTKDEHKTKVMN